MSDIVVFPKIVDSNRFWCVVSFAKKEERIETIAANMEKQRRRVICKCLHETAATLGWDHTSVLVLCLSFVFILIEVYKYVLKNIFLSFCLI